MAVWLDDAFYEHPKLVAAGGDAVLLWVCVLAYARRNLTEGTVPRGIIGRLTDRKNPERLARRLVDVGLWEPDDKADVYYFHDYPDWNRTDAERSAKARRAAYARWGPKHPSSNASSNAQASAEHVRSHPPSNADAHAQAMLGDAIALSPGPGPGPGVGYPSPDVEVHRGTRGELGDRDLDDNGQNRDETAGHSPNALLARLVGVCSGRNRDRVRIEAIEVLGWARPHVDDQLIDEAIGYCGQAHLPPALPRAVAEIIGRRAHDAGIDMPEFHSAVKTA